jgi:hypothetical protein
MISSAWYVRCDVPRCMRTKTFIGPTQAKTVELLRGTGWSVTSKGDKCPIHAQR